MLIAIDMDNTLLDSGSFWFKYLYCRYKQKEESYRYQVVHKGMPYNLTEMFIIPEGDNPKAFWKNSHLYEGMKPYSGAVEYTQKLKEDGHTLVCVSRVTGDHAGSKCKWIKKWFPHFDGIILTGPNEREKTFVKCDVIVDDSLSQLNMFEPWVHRFHYKTDYIQQGVIANEGIVEVGGWEDVYNKIKVIGAV